VHVDVHLRGDVGVTAAADRPGRARRIERSGGRGRDGDGNLVPARMTEHGPGDVRRGDRWLPLHFKPAGPAPLFESADAYDREEHAAIREPDFGLSREAAERAADL
jgi:hypothetical protein